MFELQSEWIASVLSGRVALPSQEEMMEDTEAFYLSLEASNIPKRYTHNMADSHVSLMYHIFFVIVYEVVPYTKFLLVHVHLSSSGKDCEFVKSSLNFLVMVH